MKQLREWIQHNLERLRAEHLFGLFFSILAVKVLLMILFSSDYQDTLFIPFVQYAVEHLQNPWKHFFELQEFNKFPYPPLMLYIQSIAYLPIHLLSAVGANVLPLQHFFFKLPTLIADLVILFTLGRMFPNRLKEILLFYFASPIILYASYIHSQLDLLPTAALFLSLFYLSRNRFLWAAIAFAAAVSIKFHIIAALPLLLIFLYKSQKPKAIAYFIGVPLIAYAFLTLPYLRESGYVELVLQNREQSQVFASLYSVGSLSIFFVPFTAFLIYMRFFAYRKVNQDLLFSFLGLLFSIFVFFLPPGPGWYVWIVPFISVLFINQYQKQRTSAVLLFGGLSILYLIYFILFHIHPSLLVDIRFLSLPLEHKITNSTLTNVFFTLLEAMLFATIFLLYRFGIRSNAIYRKYHAITIGIGGDSGAGKTTVLADMKHLLHEDRILEVEGDADHRWERGHDQWNVFTHLNPKANYLHQQAEHLMKLKRGDVVERVEYDHSTGTFTKPKPIHPKNFIIMSGLHPFYLPKMRRIIDVKIYLDTEEQLRRHWKIVRDMKKRNYSKETVIEQIEKRMPDAAKYIHPQKKFANLTVRYFTEDQFELGHPAHNPSVKLQLTFDSSINLEPLLSYLHSRKIPYLHDYTEDLQSQELIISLNNQTVTAEEFEELSKAIIPNREEIVHHQIRWKENYRGFIQLVTLLMISEQVKDRNHDHNTE